MDPSASEACHRLSFSPSPPPSQASEALPPLQLLPVQRQPSRPWRAPLALPYRHSRRTTAHLQLNHLHPSPSGPFWSHDLKLPCGSLRPSPLSPALAVAPLWEVLPCCRRRSPPPPPPLWLVAAAAHLSSSWRSIPSATHSCPMMTSMPLALLRRWGLWPHRGERSTLALEVWSNCDWGGMPTPGRLQRLGRTTSRRAQLHPSHPRSR
mmetsp:Transcript_7073/g.15476  ORF Transcript_7073/g.15476 Transcript_7073/m.15476 type:complete len:208 (-) Transcript_7073:304-927(-)